MPNFNHLQQMQSAHGGSPLMSTGLPLGLGLPQSPQMPQLVLASGQLGQGIQGAQVLIPTPQGELEKFLMSFPAVFKFFFFFPCQA
jgi:hypothetical protein